MAMGQRRREEQSAMFVAVRDLARSVSHPFYEKLNRLLAEHGFDDFVEMLTTDSGRSSPYHTGTENPRVGGSIPSLATSLRL
jgi:hypothetical protein